MQVWEGGLSAQLWPRPPGQACPWRMGVKLKRHDPLGGVPEGSRTGVELVPVPCGKRVLDKVRKPRRRYHVPHPQA